MNQTNIFYIAGGNVPADALSYVTRDADTLLLQRLLQGEFCYILTTRQMGKSSLMTHMVKRLREHNVAPAVLDLSSQGFSLSAEQWYNGLLDQLGRRLKLGDEIEDFCLQHASLSPLQLWQKALREVVLQTLSGQVTIFIDEVDVVRSLPFSTDEFFAAIRACYNARTEDATFTRLNFCLLGVATPADLISDPRLTPFNIGARIELTDFSREEARGLEHGLGQGAETNRLLMDRVYYWTAGHPYLTQRLCQTVAANDANLTEASIDACAERLFLSSKAQLQDSNLTFVHQRMLPLDEEQRVGMLTLYARVLSGKAVADNDTAAFVSDLKLAGIVQAVKGQLKVRNRIYAHVFDGSWIKENMPGAELRRVRAAYWRGLAFAGTLAALILTIMGGLAAWAIHNAHRADVSAKKAARNEKLADANAQQAKRDADAARKATSRADASAKEATMSATLATQQKHRADDKAHLADIKAHEAEIQRDEAQHLNYIANMNLIPASYDKNDFGLIRAILGETRTSKFRGFEWDYWHRLCHLNILELTGHSNRISAVAYSTNGRWIVTGSYDQTAKVWDAVTGHETLTLKGHSHFVTSVAFSPDGKRIATGSEDNSAKIWDAFTGQEILTLKGHADAVTSVAFSPDGKRIITGSDDKTTKIWDAYTGYEMLTLKGHSAGVTSVAFSPDGKRIVTGSNDRTAKIWDALTGREILMLTGHSKRISSVAFSPDGKRIVTGSDDQTAKVWDAAIGRATLELNQHNGAVLSVAFSSDGRRIATASGNLVNIWFSDPRDWNTAIAETNAVNGHLANAVLLENNRNYAEAVAECIAASRLRPLDASILGKLGWYEYLAGRIDDAIKVSRSALAHDSTLTYIKFNLGLCYATLNDWNKAKQEYGLALKNSKKTELAASIDDVQTAIKKQNNPALQQALTYLKAFTPAK